VVNVRFLFFEIHKQLIYPHVLESRNTQNLVELSYNWDSFLQMLDDVDILYPQITEKVVMSCRSKGGFR
jgi:hypothetical protein